MKTTDLELLAQIWDDKSEEMKRAVLEIERTDQDEVSLAIKVNHDSDIFVYLEPDRAVQLAQALILEASKEWRGASS